MLPPDDLKAVHQAVDPLNSVMLGLVGQVGVADGGENRVMAKILLHLDQIDAGFDQMSRVTVATMP